MQSARAGAPLEAANTISATAATATIAATMPITVFSRRPQRSGSESRRACSCITMPEG